MTCWPPNGEVTYPLARRPQKVNINLYRETWKKVTAWQREEAKYRGKYKPLGPTHELDMVPAGVQESEVFPEEMEAYLLDLLYRTVTD